MQLFADRKLCKAFKEVKVLHVMKNTGTFFDDRFFLQAISLFAAMTAYWTFQISGRKY